MTGDVGLVLARFSHYAATTMLAGLSFFPLYAYVGAEPKALCAWRRWLLLLAAVMAFLSGLLWFVLSVANMSGNLADLVDPEVLLSVVRDTGFGVVWTARLVLAGIIVGVTAMRFSSAATGRDLTTSSLAALLLISLAGTGHSQIESGWASVVHVTSDAAHLLAAGAWLGGLVPLAFILVCHTTPEWKIEPLGVNEILLRFSGMGYVAVATLIGSGLVNSWFLVGSLSNLLKTSYGQVLLMKLVLFAAMIAFAAANRLWLVPAMSAIRTDASAVSSLFGRLRNHVIGEQLLGLTVLFGVSLLGIMRPAIGQ
ncbi:MAG: copper homeostasis membrane protein CopD [Afipia sp.]|nr:copper homeostasis membrane protein CopD [Afipia sp.]